jgi:hypothetical protein
MDRQQIQSSELIERYLQGRLSPAEEQALEEAYLADPQLLEELQLAERLRGGLADWTAAEQALRPKSSSRWLALASSPRYGIAASLLAAVALVAAGSLYVENQGLQAPGTGFGAARHARVLPLVSVRGAGDANVIAAPPADEWTVLLLDTGFADYEVFGAALLAAGSDEELLRLDGMAASDGTVAFGVPGSALAPGRYEIRLVGARSDWPAGRALDELSRTPLTVNPRP